MLQISEIRTIAADDLWLSPSLRPRQRRPPLHLDRGRGGRARRWLPRVEEALAPFDARPHWGKVFSTPPRTVADHYERWADFTALSQRFDPDGVLRNDLLLEYFA